MTKKIRRAKVRISQLWVPILMLLIMLYSYHQMFSDENGVIAWYALKAQVSDLQRENAAMRLQAEQTEQKLFRLQEGNLDVDFLDELIRRNLPYMHPNETVMFME